MRSIVLFLRNIVVPLLVALSLIMVAAVAANDPRTTPPLGYKVF